MTGFLVDTAEQAGAAVARITRIDRAGCRTGTGQRFGVDRTVPDYLAVYADIIRWLATLLG